MKKWLIITLLVLWLPCFVWFILIVLSLLSGVLSINISLLDNISNAIRFNDHSDLGSMFAGFTIMTLIYLVIIAIVTVRMHSKLQKKTTEAKEKADREKEIIDQEDTTGTTYSIGSSGTIYADTGEGLRRINWYRVKQAILWVLIAILAIFIYPVDAIRWLVAQKKQDTTASAD